MENMKFSMQFSNIRSIPFDKYEKNFTFIVNGKHIQTSRFLADIYSPIISKRHFEDETSDVFTINTPSGNTKSEEIFDKFLTLISKKDVELNEEERTQYSEFFLELGNYEEYFRLVPFDFENLSPENIFDRLKIITKMKNSEVIEDDKFQKNFKYASEHFYEISKEKLKTVDMSLLEEIIKKENLRLEDEDSLLLFILDLYEENHEYSSLFEYFKFNELSEETMNRFIDSFDAEFLNQRTLRTLCKGIMNKNDQNKDRYCEKAMLFSHKEGEEFKGIMRYLSDQTGGNIHDNGTIEITSNSIYDNNCQRNLVDYQNNNRFRFKDIENSELYFDFKDKRIQITNYSIKSMNWGKDNDNLKNWVVEVSNDKKSWEKIDEHNDDPTLNGPNIIATFNTKQTKSFYQFIRLRQTGRNWEGDYHTGFYFIEFYGLMKFSKSQNQK